VARGDSTIAVALGKYLENGDGVVNSSHERINVVLQTEDFLPNPMRIRCSGAFSSDAKFDLFIENTDIRAEHVSFHNWQSCQGLV
jgi:hypothetical protein